MSRGPSSSASIFAAIASPGRRPLETARLEIGTRTEVDRTNAIEPGPLMAAATVRATRRPPTKTDWKLEVHWLVGDLQDRARWWPADGDQGAVQAAPGVLGRVDHPGGGLGIGVVAHDGHCPVAELGDGSVQAVLAAPGEHHPRTLGDEEVGGGPAEAAPPAGDDVHPIAESEVHPASLGGLGVLLELRAVELLVEPALAEQLRVRAALHDPAVVDDEDLVGAAHRREAVGDHDRGPALQRPVERLLDGELRLGVEVGRGLVEDDDARAP